MVAIVMICVNKIQSWLEKCWYQHNIPKLQLWLLWPFTKGYVFFVKFRWLLYKYKILSTKQFNVPVIVVGNITVGGTGKTPAVIYLVEFLKKNGWKPGIVSRGYKGSSRQICSVMAKSDPLRVGDEPVLIAKRTNCPVVVGRNRTQAVEYLLNNFSVNVAVTDDGLQHYALGRHIEIVLIDGGRRFGNGHCLPAGPLREPIERLALADFLVVNGELVHPGEFSMQLHSEQLYNVSNPDRQCALSELPSKTVHAVAGVANPEQFFAYLRAKGFKVIPHAFPDHYYFESYDLCFQEGYPIIVTEKDAIKCQRFATENYWCLPVQAAITTEFEQAFLKLLKQVAMHIKDK